MFRFDPFAGILTLDGRAVHLSNAELELCVALALLPAPRSTAGLIEKLHPDIEPAVAKNRLKVCIHRTRERLGADCIQSDGHAYWLSSDVVEIVNDLRRLTMRPKGLEALAESDCNELTHLIERMLQPRPQCMLEWEWFAPIYTRIETSARAMAATLAERALLTGDVWQAINIAAQIVALDPWDEPLRAILIRAHLHAGRHGEAIREYRRYECAIRRDLQARPSPYLRKMIEEIVA